MTGSSRELSEIVVQAVAEQQGVEGPDLKEPLYDAIDPDALDSLFRDTQGEVTFQYQNLVLTVGSNYEVFVTTREQSSLLTQ